MLRYGRGGGRRCWELTTTGTAAATDDGGATCGGGDVALDVSELLLRAMAELVETARGGLAQVTGSEVDIAAAGGVSHRGGL